MPSQRLSKWEQRALLHAAQYALAAEWDESMFETEEESEHILSALESARDKLLERDLW